MLTKNKWPYTYNYTTVLTKMHGAKIIEPKSSKIIVADSNYDSDNDDIDDNILLFNNYKDKTIGRESKKKIQSSVEYFNNKNLNYSNDINETNKNYIQVCYDAKQSRICFVKNGHLTKKICSNLFYDDDEKRFFKDGNIMLDWDNFQYLLYFESSICYCQNCKGFRFGFKW